MDMIFSQYENIVRILWHMVNDFCVLLLGRICVVGDLYLSTELPRFVYVVFVQARKEYVSKSGGG